MLNKQGLFNRANETNPARSTLGALNAAKLNPTPANITDADTVSDHDAKPDTEAKVDATSGSRLIVGPDVKLRGAEIQDCDTLVVEGRVEATMDSRVIQIAEHGAFSGKVGIDVAEVYGQFDGELTARSQLIIHSSGRVSGKIRYGKIFIEEGGEVSGDIASLTAEKGKALTSSLRTANGAKHD